MGRFKVILVIWFIVQTYATFAKSMEGSQIESLTYRLYTEQKWDSLATVGSTAIKEGTNYYYLSYRVGFANYMLQRYRIAIKYFKYALSFNSDDSYSLGYLYLSYIYSGRKEEALLAEKHLTKEQKEYFKIKAINSISLDLGPVLSTNLKKNAATLLLPNDSSVIGMKDLTNNFKYIGIGLQHKLFGRMIVNHSFSMLNIEKFREFGYIESTETHPNVETHVPFTDSLHYTLMQLDYFVGVTIPLKYGFVVSPSFHLLYCSFANRLAANVFTPVNPLLPLPQTYSTYKFTEKDTTFSNFAYSLAITKNFNAFSITPSINYAKLNGYTQKGSALSVSLFPKKNLNLYTTTTIMANIDNGTTKKFANQLVGFKVFTFLWTELQGGYGDLSNGMEGNGFLVYNNPDKSMLRGGANLIFSFKHIELSIRYQYIQMQTKSYISSLSPANNFSVVNSTQIYNYTNNTLIGGIKWNL